MSQIGAYLVVEMLVIMIDNVRRQNESVRIYCYFIDLINF